MSPYANHNSLALVHDNSIPTLPLVIFLFPCAFRSPTTQAMQPVGCRAVAAVQSAGPVRSRKSSGCPSYARSTPLNPIKTSYFWIFLIFLVPETKHFFGCFGGRKTENLCFSLRFGAAGSSELILREKRPPVWGLFLGTQLRPSKDPNESP